MLLPKKGRHSKQKEKVTIMRPIWHYTPGDGYKELGGPGSVVERSIWSPPQRRDILEETRGSKRKDGLCSGETRRTEWEGARGPHATSFLCLRTQLNTRDTQ
ncbi:hypothetical protein MRX96_032613 [Rhipicephalus microplus]